MTTENISENRRWLSVFALAFAAFIFNTTEFIPIALLNSIGESFHLSPTQTGVMITVYAWIVALCSLPLMLLTRKMERRALLLGLFAMFAVSHVLSFMAWNFSVLLISRIGIALTHAVFWSITAALAVRIAPKGKGNQALGFLSTGTVLAMVMGIPIGRVIGNAYGWRISFLLIGVIAVVTAVVLAKNLPVLPSVNSGSLASLPVLVKRKSLVLLFVFTVLAVTSHFTAYSYIEPFALQVGHFAPSTVTALLVIYGVAGFVGSYAFSRYCAKNVGRFFVICCVLQLFSMALIYPFSSHVAALFALCFIWGIGITALSLTMLSRVLHLASDATDVAASIYSGLYNVGIGGGALFGHYAVSWFDLKNIGLSGAAIALMALVLSGILVMREDFLGQTKG